MVVKYEDKVFNERVRYSDAAFLQMFTFPLKWGSPASLADVNSIILSETMSIKYFGSENPLGRSILVKFDKDRSKAFKVTGVAQAFPKACTIDFGFLINFENFRISDAHYDFHDWNNFVAATFIQVDRPEHMAAIEKRMDKYRSIQNNAVRQKGWAIASFSFEPLATLHERSEYIRDDISYSSRGNYDSVLFLSVIAIFLLALACFNYINIAIVTAAKRLKEIGVRKSIGASRGVIIAQFLAENILITFFALVIGVVLGTTLFIPWFESLWHFSMGFTLNDKTLWIYLPAILLLTGVASGLYPALYISRFQVVSILKGSVKFGQKNPITKIFLGLQFFLACILITCGVMFTQNSAYLAKRGWGYNPGAVLYAEVPDELAFEQLSAAMAPHPGVLSISGSAHHLGRKNAEVVLHLPDREYEVDQLAVDARYFETLQLPLQQGRLFNDHEGSDRQAVVVNALLAKNMAWQQPIGQVFEMDSMCFEVVGVVHDFHHDSFSQAIRPTLFRVANKADYRYLSMRVRAGAEPEAYSTLRMQWAKLFPETPFQGGYQESKIKHALFEKISADGKAIKPEGILFPMEKWHLYAQFKNRVNTGGQIRFV